MSLGIVVVSHVPEIAAGVQRLLAQVAKDVSITIAGGTDDDQVGTSMAKITEAFEANTADELLAFYDLGSAKMNLEMAIEMSTKPVHLYDTALVESAYTAASLLQADVPLADVEAQLAPLKIK
ncbi:PTS-dependent dihydroxyacetone kinase phosphotransferase subunit DhaM [Lactobacillus pentosus]|jgi:dihydroxyacetone kinase phosphotransfer subunit|uniref:phosphoenolpyruvate--glycerone phosphotransferase n=1 Tax=Lactiplantibacillus pentosus TaxID=1589 RepID=A0A2S9VUA5_LACPE|nr:dihydroxyacetone kinase phosphoryl donor subunit DhaM [Lactiplantibacillus pentosus]BBM21568.1 dihydroxyacetone phosphotransferase, phosphoryl donor protein [Lactiplantibacillus plantarum]ASG79682.1 PTS mannose family transporter subunit IIA [Lactiplantibacillus pentosus]AYG39012.1 PTS-dependent dihydroxyacetone kinase phosphotransferase subunit DhaM [Lactiplantibacillus pentosus]AYG41671.1 PTS-dependent dihydroxyacetone kinase phosphotransferase subunit DhaM [Lactiplantibacillus pentosus]M